jgi:hypothetical protein
MEMSKLNKMTKTRRTVVLAIAFLCCFGGVIGIPSVMGVGIGTNINTISVTPGATIKETFFLIVHPNETGNFSLSIEGPGASWISLPFSNVSIPWTTEEHRYRLPLDFVFPLEGYGETGNTYLVLSTLGQDGSISSTVQRRLALPLVYDASLAQQTEKEEVQEIHEDLEKKSDEEVIKREDEQKVARDQEPTKTYPGELDGEIEEDVITEKDSKVLPLLVLCGILLVSFLIVFLLSSLWPSKQQFYPTLLFALHFYLRHGFHLPKVTELLLTKGWQETIVLGHIAHLRKHYSLYERLYGYIERAKRQGHQMQEVQRLLKQNHWPVDITTIYVEDIYTNKYTGNNTKWDGKK